MRMARRAVSTAPDDSTTSRAWDLQSSATRCSRAAPRARSACDDNCVVEVPWSKPASPVFANDPAPECAGSSVAVDPGRVVVEPRGFKRCGEGEKRRSCSSRSAIASATSPRQEALALISDSDKRPAPLFCSCCRITWSLGSFWTNALLKLAAPTRSPRSVSIFKMKFGKIGKKKKKKKNNGHFLSFDQMPQDPSPYELLKDIVINL